MGKSSDVRVVDVCVHFLPLEFRLPLKFGAETVTRAVTMRVGMRVEGRDGRRAEGWGETPLSVTWVWPSSLSYDEREGALKSLCLDVAGAWRGFGEWGHPMEVGYGFLEGALPGCLKGLNGRRAGKEQAPWLSALVCASPFDIALHDAYGNLHGAPVYETYNARWMSRDLGGYLRPAEGADVSFAGRYPEDFFVRPRADRLAAWHLVGGKDAVGREELTGGEPKDGVPVELREWIRRDGLKCLKIKLRGNDGGWDYGRMVQVGRMAIEEGVDWLTADFNCTVTEPGYVNEILDRLVREEPRIYGMILYVEQPFPYDLESHRIDVHSVSARKPLFMDESAHDWRLIGLGRSLGWTGVALKTCKTQTGALLSACWAKGHGMTLMVQDLTNPMLAQVPHCLLAAHVGTIMGVETNATQFYPAVSGPEGEVHPGLYRRREGCVDLGTVRGPGFGYRVGEMRRVLPKAAMGWGTAKDEG